MLFLTGWVFFGILTAIVAGNKGRPAWLWLIFGLIFGVFAFLLALVVSKVEKPRGPQISVPFQTGRDCPFCAERIKVEAIVCKHCGRDVPPYEAPPPAPRQPVTDQLWGAPSNTPGK